MRKKCALYRIGLLMICFLSGPSGAWGGVTDDAAYRKILWNHLEVLCSFGPRYPGSPGHVKTREYIKKVAAAYGDEWHEQNFQVQVSSMRLLSLQNIEINFRGRNPGQPVLLGAHYDSRPFADEEKDESRREEPILGANDGGSGTAVLLAFAQYFRENPPSRPVRLVFFDGEDYGRKGSGEYFLGSQFYANQLEEIDKSLWPYCVLVVDMVGDKDLKIFLENHSARNARWLLDRVFQVAREMGFPQFVPKFRYTIDDDHLPFIYLKIPAVVLIDFDYPYWHTHQDTLDKCSEESMWTVFSVVVETVDRL